MSVRRMIALVACVGAVLPLACSTEPSEGTPDAAAPEADAAAAPDGAAEEKECQKPEDCPSKVCTAARRCAPPSPTDGVQNADETDVDCGGSAPKCSADKKCKVAADCVSGVCKDTGAGLLCRVPAPDDGVANGDETDVDCGGLKAPKCADTKKCKVRGDCASDVCEGGVCKAPAIDGVKNGTETDVDCGGPTAPRCVDGLSCLLDADCTSDVCKDVGMGLKCQAPSPTDGKKNGAETDVDCGGVGNPACATGKTCLVHADCQSDLRDPLGISRRS